MSSLWRTFVLPIPRMAALLTSVVAALALAGWVLHIPILTSVLPGLVAMKVNSAIGFMVLAGALYLAQSQHHPFAQGAFALPVALLGGLTLVEWATGTSLGIDEFILPEPGDALQPGRMAPVAAFSFLVLGTALFPFKTGWMDHVREGLALLACLASVFAIVGYLYGVPILYGSTVSSHRAMALNSGGNFLLISSGFLFVPRQGGFMRIFWGRSIGSMVARSLIPVAVLVPVLLGVLFIRSLSFGHVQVSMALSVVSNVVLLVSLIWYLSFTIQRAEKERAVVQKQAQTDRLTGIFNRRYFESDLEHEVQRTKRYGVPLSLLMMDVDNFKEVNDRFGHLVGDRVLKCLARECERNLRATDVLCRYGGEEFAVIAPETSAEAALLLAKRIREAVAALRLEGLPASITVSLGVAAWGEHFVTLEDLVAAADQALYNAKKMGKNNECLYGAPAPRAAAAG